ncbi:hypothetical protein BO94DRAFT_220408 [Aspergillus sclerotioniger CBS 115572]|uniref:Uncharacterized protein n=1 Tax=Aspergillus sclerotioniger CBS 115572 TaxID=1450535 RepID=A0A317XEV9_9EURO|nr:hypothetical protein BO94DRAFT_220408 [Aspergillus sclerotioniger CBS 115572]PWY95170.1 hypothetical protein BO94DRAFT_220408 [Aspergillus sclerotioniger CBS 115572]
MTKLTASENQKPEQGQKQQRQLSRTQKRKRQRQRKQEKEISALGQEQTELKKKTQLTSQQLRNIKKSKRQRHRQRLKERRRQGRETQPEQQPLRQNQGPDQDGAASEHSVDLEREREEDSMRAEYEELLKERRREARDWEETKMAEVKRSYESLRNGQRGPRIYIADTHFELFCLEYFDHFYNPEHENDFLIKFVEFEHQRGNRKEGLPPAGLRRVNGNVWLETEAEPTFEPFVVPAYASRNVIRVRNPWHEKHEMSVQFVSDDHLILYLCREAVFEPRPPPPDVPKVFIFFGVRARGERVLLREREEWADDLA